eukprot:7842994-Pyramimonas_sp.AAC.1
MPVLLLMELLLGLRGQCLFVVAPWSACALPRRLVVFWPVHCANPGFSMSEGRGYAHRSVDIPCASSDGVCVCVWCLGVSPRDDTQQRLATEP